MVSTSKALGLAALLAVAWLSGLPRAESAPPTRRPEFAALLLARQERAAEFQGQQRQAHAARLTHERIDRAVLLFSPFPPAQRAALLRREAMLLRQQEQITVRLAQLNLTVPANPRQARQLERLKARLIQREQAVATQLARVERQAATPSSPSSTFGG